MATIPASKKCELSWIPALNRWRKKYRGKQYYFAFPKSQYREALKAWKSKKEEVDATAFDANAGKRNLVLGRLGQWLTTETMSTEDRQAVCDLLGVEIDLQAITDRVAEAMDGPAPAPKPASVAENVAEYLDELRNKAIAGQMSTAYYDNTRIHLERFTTFHGADQPVKEISAKSLAKFHADLMKKIGAGEIGNTYARGVMGTIKRWTLYLYRQDLIARPKNLDGVELAIAVDEHEIEIFPLDEITNLLKKAEGKTRLYLLLQLNCGMTQKDISDLTHAQIDFAKGVIKRKRSKTKRRKSVPTVTYTLWPETLELLREHKSNHETLALVNQDGKALCRQEISTEGKNAGKNKRCDAIRTAYSRLFDKNKPTRDMKCLKKTSATLLKSNPSFRGLVSYFLGHAGERATVADLHYARESDKLFAEALAWLRAQYTF